MNMHTPGHKVRTLGDVIDRIEREERQATAPNSHLTDPEFLRGIARTMHSYPSMTVDRVLVIAERIEAMSKRLRDQVDRIGELEYVLEGLNK